jgi:nicotinamide mononucleotide transporter
MLHWLFDAQLTIAGHPILWREIIGNGFGFASALGGMRRRVWAWPVGIAGNLLLFTVFAGVAFGNPQGATLWGQAGRQVFFVVASGYGWWRWSSARRRAPGGDLAAVTPRWADARERLICAVLAAAGVLGCYLAFRAIGAGFPAPWWYYLADAWIFVGSILATYAMARGWVEFWLCWIAVDAVGVPELLHFRFYPSATLYALYAAFVLYGFTVWHRLERTTRPTAALEIPV